MKYLDGEVIDHINDGFGLPSGAADREIANTASEDLLRWVIDELRADVPLPKSCDCHGEDVYVEGQRDALQRMIRFFQHELSAESK